MTRCTSMASSKPAPTAEANGQNGRALTLNQQSQAAGIGSETIDDFLDRQPRSILIRLYEKPASCLAIFRLLPIMARQLVMHMLFLQQPPSIDDLHVWIKKDGRASFQAAVEKLVRLSIVKQESVAGRPSQILLNGVFTKGMQRALIGGGDHRSFGVPCDTEDKNAVDVAYLDEYARTKWETILHYMVGSQGSVTPREPVLCVLRRSNLMQEGSKGSSRLSITSRGFQFLLESVNTQLWYLLLQYLDMAEGRSFDLVEVLAFLFMLGSLELGRDYSTEELPETQLHMLEDFRDYGLVYQRKASSRRFYPTRLATTLTSNAATPLLASNGNEQEERGYIVLETNYRVYAYTSSPLRVAVLKLFVTVKARFPNLVVGSITRDSVKSALANGITAEQMYRSDPLLPVTVSDQIRLWEREKNRVGQELGALFTEFSSQADFEQVRNYADQMGVLLWQDESKRCFFVAEEGFQPVRDFIRRRVT
ncbi:probable TFB2 - TFIIH subunit (transcription/repair factor) [Pseudozyma flocculosa]|uniref:RNA polymerase II transcription factor B subunit 2 n=1 Tax=Pseudozyma flocculosa TaxID=84751 RepID=A0A5C3F053_9BASI|nr:probable TFB2 - TFIIH subunit (transcription/repair factor) [Pseudozyma flocculosa]